MHRGAIGDCCDRPDYRRSYAPRKRFGKSVYCLNCHTLILDEGIILGLLWQWLVYPFWDGRVLICGEPVYGD